MTMADLGITIDFKTMFDAWKATHAEVIATWSNKPQVRNTTLITTKMEQLKLSEGKLGGPIKVGG